MFGSRDSPSDRYSQQSGPRDPSPSHGRKDALSSGDITNSRKRQHSEGDQELESRRPERPRDEYRRDEPPYKRGPGDEGYRGFRDEKRGYQDSRDYGRGDVQYSSKNYFDRDGYDRRGSGYERYQAERASSSERREFSRGSDDRRYPESDRERRAEMTRGVPREIGGERGNNSGRDMSSSRPSDSGRSGGYSDYPDRYRDSYQSSRDQGYRPEDPGYSRDVYSRRDPIPPRASDTTVPVKADVASGYNDNLLKRDYHHGNQSSGYGDYRTDQRAARGGIESSPYASSQYNQSQASTPVGRYGDSRTTSARSSDQYVGYSTEGTRDTYEQGSARGYAKDLYGTDSRVPDISGPPSQYTSSGTKRENTDDPIDDSKRGRYSDYQRGYGYSDSGYSQYSKVDGYSTGPVRGYSSDGSTKPISDQSSAYYPSSQTRYEPQTDYRTGAATQGSDQMSKTSAAGAGQSIDQR